MSAATPARDTDSSVEQDPEAGRSVDRAPRLGRSRARRDRRWTLVDQRAGRRATTGRERARPAMVERTPGSIVSSSNRWRRGSGHGPDSARADRAGRDPRRPSAHREVRSGRERHSRATGDSTRSRRTSLPLVGQPIDGGTDGAPERKPIAARRKEARLRDADGSAGNGGTGSEGPSRPICTSSPDGVGGKPERDREVEAGDERQEGSRPQRCGTAADEEQTFAGWERQRGDRTRPEKLRLRRPTRPKPGEPGPGTGCNMPGAVNGGSRRGGEKPRGRSETGGVASTGRRKIPRDRPGVDVHGDIGRRAHSRGRSSRRGRSRAPRGARIRLGPAGTPEARPRWEAT